LGESVLETAFKTVDNSQCLFALTTLDDATQIRVNTIMLKWSAIAQGGNGKIGMLP